MAVLGGLIILLSMLVGLGAWIGLFKPALFKDKKTGEIPSRLSIFIRGNIGAVILLLIGGMMMPEASQQQPNGHQQTSPIAESTSQPTASAAFEKQESVGEAAKEEQPKSKPDFGMDFNTFRKYANQNLKSIKSESRVAKWRKERC